MKKPPVVIAILLLPLFNLLVPTRTSQSVGNPQAIPVGAPPCVSTLGRDYVRSSGFVVPTGKTFVLTGLASATQIYLPAVLQINGIAKLSWRMFESGLTADQAPAGIFASAGDQVAVFGAYAIGYFVDTQRLASMRYVVRCQPNPTEFVQITSAYTVPAGKSLVITAFGNTDATPILASSTEYLNINGSAFLWHSVSASNDGRWTSVDSVPEGLTANPGDVVSFTVVPSSGTSLTPIAWGYLVDY